MAVGATGTASRPSPAPRPKFDPSIDINDQVLALMRTTHTDGPIKVRESDGVFMLERSSYFDRKTEHRVTNNVGNKGWLHWKMIEKTGSEAARRIASDAAAIAYNESIQTGAIPVEELVSMTAQRRNDEVFFNVFDTLAEIAALSHWGIRDVRGRYPIIMSEKEISILSGLDGMDVRVAVGGYYRDSEEIPRVPMEGSVLVGIGSSGVHCSAVALLRDEFFVKRQFDLDTAFGQTTIGEELTKPTQNYLMAVKGLMGRIVFPINKRVQEVIRGMVHIHTREDWENKGGFVKLRELLGGSRRFDVLVTRDHTLEPQEIYRYVHKEFNIPSESMYRWFNNGIGYVIAIQKDHADTAVQLFKDYGFEAAIVGKIVPGKGNVVVESKFDNSTLAVFRPPSLLSSLLGRQ